MHPEPRDNDKPLPPFGPWVRGGNGYQKQREMLEKATGAVVFNGRKPPTCNDRMGRKLAPVGWRGAVGVQLENTQLRKVPGEEGIRLGLEVENLYVGR